MLRPALHTLGRDLPVFTRWHGKPGRALMLVAPNGDGLGYRLPALDLSDPTDNGKAFLPAGKDRVLALGRR
jgi:hypothetical protein